MQPTPAKGRGFGDKPAAKSPKDVSGWSDDEGNDNKNGDGGGDKGGYRRGGENSGGFRGRRDDDNGKSISCFIIISNCQIS